MNNLETIWCSSSYIRPLDCDIEEERKSILTESILETEYKVISASELGGIPLSGNEKLFAEQHLWNIPIEKLSGSQHYINEFESNSLSKIHYLENDTSDDSSLFFNNWGRIGRFVLFLYITFLSILQDITGIVIPNSLYKTELTGTSLQVITETPSVSIIYPLYWKYILEPTRYVISLIFYFLWRIELTSIRKFNGKTENEYLDNICEYGKEEMTWIPGTLNLIHIINGYENNYSGFSIFSKPSENEIRNIKGIRSFAREHKILNNVSDSKSSNNNYYFYGCDDPNLSNKKYDNKIKYIAVRPIGNIIAVGYSNSFSIWEYKISVLKSSGSFGMSNLSGSPNLNIRSSIDILNKNGEWKLIYHVDLFKLGPLVWSSDGSKLYVGDGSSIREFTYLYLYTNDSKKLGYQNNSDLFINNGRTVAKGPTIAHDCVSIAVSNTFSVIGAIWEGGYFRIYDMYSWEYSTVCHKFSFKKKVFLPKVICVDNKINGDLSSFIFVDSESIYELLINDQDDSEINNDPSNTGFSLGKIKNNINDMMLSHSTNQTKVYSKIRLRELPIHSRNREKTISDFCVSFQRMAIIFKESNMVWLYCYLMNCSKNSKLMLIGVIQDFGIPSKLAMQAIDENNYLVSGTFLSIKWNLENDSHNSSRHIVKEKKVDFIIKTYPLFHYNI
ncbi:hypothetical protein FG386_001000 [Cryptosporidium ryanae]|uniref:uncharacterized protein n=1 Tax=Cryptosporidium ryanae TaxID=515981 RepID=UPI003519F858|nr:hypothetical protein FG386_001000 [Cryptosporidium ryanae]